MLNLLRYIILRWDMLRIVRKRGKNRCTMITQVKLERQVKDLAWLIVHSGFRSRSFDFKIKGCLSNSKAKIIRYAEMKGEILSENGVKVSFVLSNPNSHPFHMIMRLSSGTALHGNMHYCFDHLSANK